MFLNNHWYVAAWSTELSAQPLSRTLLGEPVALFRLADGAPVALQDRCPHRNLPLSAGRVLDDVLQCGYHGLEFNAEGACTKVPGQSTIPDWCKVRSFPVEERHGWTFIWMGRPEDANSAPVPEFHALLSDENWGDARGQLTVPCGYRLMLDNLLDLSHLTYVHGSTTGNDDVANQANVQLSSDHATHVRQTRIMEGISAAPAFRYYGGYEDKIDRWQITNFLAPSYIDITNGSRRTSMEPTAPGAHDGELGEWGFRVFHAITPETHSSTHQFWSVPFRHDMVQEKDHALWNEQMANVLREDHDVYVLQQQAIDANPAAEGDVVPAGGLVGDKGLFQMRRVLEGLHRREAQLTREGDAPDS